MLTHSLDQNNSKKCPETALNLVTALETYLPQDFAVIPYLATSMYNVLLKHLKKLSGWIRLTGVLEYILQEKAISVLLLQNLDFNSLCYLTFLCDYLRDF